MFGFMFNAIKLGFYSDFEKRSWYIICTAASVPEDYDDYIDYEDQLFLELAVGVSKHIKKDVKEVVELFGEWFIKVQIKEWNMNFLGRTPGDFFRSWNDFFDYKSYEYTGLMYESYTVSKEDEQGFDLAMRCWAPNMAYFGLGIIKFVLKNLFRLHEEGMSVVVEPQQVDGYIFQNNFRLQFDNTPFFRNSDEEDFSDNELDEIMPLTSLSILSLFPFFIYFDRFNEIHSVGSTLDQIMPNLVRSKLNKNFSLRKPKYGTLTWNYIRSNTHMVFELCSKGSEGVTQLLKNEENEIDLHFRLLGQIQVFEDTGDALFLCSPRLESLSACKSVYLGDLEAHDTTKNQLVSSSLRLHLIRRLLDEERERSMLQNQYLSVLNTEMRITEGLIKQIMPRDVALQIREGTPFVNTCEEYSEATVLFSDLVGFTEICSGLSPMQVAALLNRMYMTFDTLTDANSNVYKVETIGDAYMLVSGLPDRTEHHAKHAADVAMEMVQAIQKVKINFLKEPLSVKLGMHSGPVVAGVVGWKVPRYCLFGDTVNTASRMESASEALKIHISDSTNEHLKRYGNYITRQRGWHSHKGKGQLPTYWLCGQGDNILPSYTQTELMEEEAKKQVNQVLEQVNEGAQLSADVLNQLSNNPALQRQINPLQKVAELSAESRELNNDDEREHKNRKQTFNVRNVSTICTIL
ncbi:hypothetical protein ACHWQZ_G004430 [Mnemiopsis leidyi]